MYCFLKQGLLVQMIQGAMFLFLQTTVFAQGLPSFHVFAVVCPGLGVRRASPIKDGEHHQLPDSGEAESTKYEPVHYHFQCTAEQHKSPRLHCFMGPQALSITVGP